MSKKHNICLAGITHAIMKIKHIKKGDTKMTNLIEVIKTNKKAILTKALIVGGTILGLVIATKMVMKNGSDNEEVDGDVVDTSTAEFNEV